MAQRRVRFIIIIIIILPRLRPQQKTEEEEEELHGMDTGTSFAVQLQTVRLLRFEGRTEFPSA